MRTARATVSVRGTDAGTTTNVSGSFTLETYPCVDKVPVTFDNSTHVRSDDLLGAEVEVRREVAGNWLLDASAVALTYRF